MISAVVYQVVQETRRLREVGKVMGKWRRYFLKKLSIYDLLKPSFEPTCWSYLRHNFYRYSPPQYPHQSALNIFPSILPTLHLILIDLNLIQVNTMSLTEWIGQGPSGKVLYSLEHWCGWNINDILHPSYVASHCLNPKKNILKTKNKNKHHIIIIPSPKKKLPCPPSLVFGRYPVLRHLSWSSTVAPVLPLLMDADDGNLGEMLEPYGSKWGNKNRWNIVFRLSSSLLGGWTTHLNKHIPLKFDDFPQGSGWKLHII